MKKLSMVIAGAVLSALCLRLEAAHAQSGNSPSATNDEGNQNFLVVPPGAPNSPVYDILNGRATFLATGKDTGGQFSLFDVTIPSQRGTPSHLQNNESQAWYVLDGDLKFQLGDQTVDATPGTFVYIPKSTPLGFQNFGTTPVRTLGLVAPSGVEGFFEEEGYPVTDRSTQIAPPRPVAEVAPIASKYGFSVQPVSPSTGSQGYVVVPPGAPGRPSFNVGGDLYTSLATKDETGGQFSLFDVSLPAQTGPGLLQHNDQEAQSFYVLDGDVTLQVGDKTTVATPGLLGFGTCVGTSLVLKRKQKKQKSANLDPNTGTVWLTNQ